MGGADFVKGRPLSGLLNFFGVRPRRLPYTYNIYTRARRKRICCVMPAFEFKRGRYWGFLPVARQQGREGGTSFI